MRINVLNTTVVLVDHDGWSRSFCKKLLVKNCRMSVLPVRRNIYLLAPQKSLNISIRARNLHRTENFQGPTYQPNFVFLGAPGPIARGDRIPPGRLCYGKEPDRARVMYTQHVQNSKFRKLLKVRKRCLDRRVAT